MEKRSWQSIRNYLAHLEPLQPLPTKIEESWQHDPDIRACIFDIYGTLIISASGDIDQAEFHTSFLEEALQMAHIDIIPADPQLRQDALNQMITEFRQTISREHEKSRAAGNPYPEVVITQIWQQVLERFQQKGLLNIFPESDVTACTFLFELMSNKVYPMPHMQHVLKNLEEKGYPLGIVSNAQFYTPMIMNFFLEDELTEGTQIKHFEPQLSVYSYQMGKAKPDRALFETLSQRLQKDYGLNPGQTLYVGNDMYKDVWPAQQAGFKTALFAGDARSLRLRQDNPAMDNVRPDHIIRDLKRLLEIVP
jgi:putative hydrolase of the HAD superfamily